MSYWWNRSSIGWVGAVYAIVVCIPIVLAHNASAAGNGLYVADGNRTVRFKLPHKNGGTEDLVLGQPDFTSNTPSTALSGMNVPLGVIFQPSSKTLWVADEDNSRVLGFVHGKSGFSNGQDADIELGNPDFSNINGPCNVSQNGLCDPTDVAFDSAGNLWVSDGGGSRVLEFEPPLSTGQDASLVIGKPDFNSRGCSTPTQDGLCTPWSLASIRAAIFGCSTAATTASWNTNRHSATVRMPASSSASQISSIVFARQGRTEFARPPGGRCEATNSVISGRLTTPTTA
jgi:hypothetical protein